MDLRARLWLLTLAAAVSLLAVALRGPPELPRGPAPPVRGDEDGARRPALRYRVSRPAAAVNAVPEDSRRAEPRLPGELTVFVRRDETYEVGGSRMDRDGLRAVLADHADGARDEDHRWRASERRVLLRVDSGTLWRPVFVALKVCSAPDVRIWRVRIGVGDEPAVALPLDRDRMVGYALVRIEDVPEVAVTLKHLRSGGQTRVVLLDRELGTGLDAFSALAVQFGAIRRSDPEVPGVFQAWPAVPVEDVMRLLRTFSKAGYAPPRVEGAPPVSWRAEELRIVAKDLGPTELLVGFREALGARDFRAQDVARDLITRRGQPMVEALAAALAALPWREDGGRELPALLDALLWVEGPDGETVDLYAALGVARAAVRAFGVGAEQLAEIERRVGASPGTR